MHLLDELMASIETAMPASPMRESARGLISLLTLLQLAYRREVGMMRLLPLIKAARTEASAIIAKYKIKPKPIDDTITMLKASKKSLADEAWMPVEAYAKHLVLIRMELLKNNRKWLTDPDLTPDMVLLSNYLIRMMGAKDGDALTKVEKNLETKLRLLGNPAVSRLYTPEYDDQTEKVNELKFIVTKLTGRKGDTVLTPEEIEKHKNGKEKARVERYNKLRKEANAVAKAALRAHVRESGKDYVGVGAARKALAEQGIQIHNVRHELDSLNINEDGKYVTHTGRIIDATPSPGAKITMNPKYDHKKDDTYVFKFVTNPENPKGTDARTAQQKQTNTAARDEDIAAALPLLPEAEKKWRKALLSKDPKEHVPAMIAEIIRRHGPRIGTGTGDNLGLTRLQVKHMHPQANGDVKLAYTGKSSVKQLHVLKPDTPHMKRAIEILKGLAVGKKPSDNLMTMGKGRVYAGHVNHALQEVYGLPLTAHKFRHIAANEIMQKQLDAKPLKKGANQKEAEAHFKAAALKAAMHLGHHSSTGKLTPSTVIKSYLNASHGAQWFSKGGFQIPSWLSKVKGED